MWERNGGVYCVRKVWEKVFRKGQTVVRCMDALLIAAEGLRGVVRGQRHRMTIAASRRCARGIGCAPQFHAKRPNRMWVVD